MRVSVFLLVVTAVVATVHRYLWTRLVRDPMWPAPWRTGLTWTLVALALSIPAAIMLSRGIGRPAGTALALVAYLWLGVMFYLLVLLAPLEPFRVLWRVFDRGDPFDPSRRAFLSRVVGVCGFLAAGGVVSAGVAQAVRRVAVKHVPIEVPGLDPRLDGFRIVQITDVHAGPTIGEDFVREVVETANSLDADVVAITGDLVDGTVEDLADAVAPLRDLRARQGVYFVTGNHEYYAGVGPWLDHLPSLGVRPLANEHVEVGRTGALLTLAGIHDPTGAGFPGAEGPDLAKSLAGADPALPVVLLAHQPRQVHEAQARGVAVQLSGHTHGGQLWPFGLLVRLSQPAVSGLHRFGPTALYVSCGTGYWGPPMRVGAPAEVTLVELVRAP